MAKKKPAPLGLIFGVIVAVVLGAGAVWQVKEAANAKAEKARADADIPVLPTGPLRLLAVTVKEARYLAVDGISKSGDSAEGTVLVVAKSPTEFEGAGMMSQHKRFDCAQHRVFDGAAGYFDASGKMLTRRSFYNGQRGRPTEKSEVEEAALCSGSATGQLFSGFHAAQRDIQSLPADYDKYAEAHPADPNAWAWLCKAGAEGAWRAKTPSDCDKAVNLNPGVAEMRLDRAFLDLKTGKNAAATADFNAVIAKDPKNAAALFGRGLIKELTGDKAGSKADRTAGMKIDPEVDDWISRRYALQISSADLAL